MRSGCAPWLPLLKQYVLLCLRQGQLITDHQALGSLGEPHQRLAHAPLLTHRTLFDGVAWRSAVELWNVIAAEVPIVTIAWNFLTRAQRFSKASDEIPMVTEARRGVQAWSLEAQTLNAKESDFGAGVPEQVYSSQLLLLLTTVLVKARLRIHSSWRDAGCISIALFASRVKRARLLCLSITTLPRTSPQYQESQPPSSALRNCTIDAQRRCPASRLCAPVFSPVPSQRGRPSLTRRKAECFHAAVAGVLVVAAVFCASQQCPARYFPFRGRSAPLLTGPVVSRM